MVGHATDWPWPWPSDWWEGAHRVDPSINCLGFQHLVQGFREAPVQCSSGKKRMYTGFWGVSKSCLNKRDWSFGTYSFSKIEVFLSLRKSGPVNSIKFLVYWKWMAHNPRNSLQNKEQKDGKKMLWAAKETTKTQMSVFKPCLKALLQCLRNCFIQWSIL